MIIHKGFVAYSKDYSNIIDEFYNTLMDYNSTPIDTNIFKPNDDDLDSIIHHISSSEYDDIIVELDALLEDNKTNILDFNDDNFRINPENYSKNLESYKVFCYFCSTSSELFSTDFNIIMDNSILLEKIIKYAWLIKNFINLKYRLYPNIVLNLIKNIESTNRFDLLMVFCELCPEMVRSPCKPHIEINMSSYLTAIENPMYKSIYEKFKTVIMI
jgi:hypothetical protein